MLKYFALATALSFGTLAAPHIALANTLTPAATAKSDVEAVRSVGKRWQSLYQDGKYAQIADLYSKDAIIMPRGRPAIYGREAMRQAVGGLAAGRKVSIILIEREITITGNYAWYLGDFVVTYVPQEPDKVAHTETGRSLIVYKRGPDGDWLIHRDIDAPAPKLIGDVSATMNAPWGPVLPAQWDGSDRSTVSDCDRLSASRYDRTRLSRPVAREDMDVPAVIAACEADLQRYPGDPRILFQLGRLYGYTGNAELTRSIREAAAVAGNHNAIFLLGFLDWAAAKTDVERCTAHNAMKLAADRGNYSAQLTYAAWSLEGRFDACADTASRDQINEYLRKAKPVADGFFETRFVENLLSQLGI